MTPQLRTLLEASFEKNGIFMCYDDETILNYLIDVHSREILKAFEQNKKNTGVCFTFDDLSTKRNIVLVFRMKFTGKNKKHNGLISIVITEVIVNKNGITEFNKLIHEMFKADIELRDAILNNTSKYIEQSISHNVV